MNHALTWFSKHMKCFSAVVWLVAAIPACQHSSSEANPTLSSVSSAAPSNDPVPAPPLEELALSDLFGDIVTGQPRFRMDLFAKPTGKTCELHYMPIFRKSGYRDDIRWHIAFPPYDYGALAELSGACPHSSVNGSDAIDVTPRYEGAEPYAIEYCRACNHVYQTGADRFSKLTEAERIRWGEYEEEQRKALRSQQAAQDSVE